MTEILTLQDLLSKETITEQTKYNIEILERLEEAKELLENDILDKEELTNLIDVCIQCNMDLWLYISRLAEVQGFELSEYQG